MKLHDSVQQPRHYKEILNLTSDLSVSKPTYGLTNKYILNEDALNTSSVNRVMPNRDSSAAKHHKASFQCFQPVTYSASRKLLCPVIGVTQ
jgi:hypothetical protein